MTPKRAREIGLEAQTDGSYRQMLFTVYIGGKSEHRMHWSKYNPAHEYGMDEAMAHAKEAACRLSTVGKKVKVLREITTVETVYTV